MDSSLMGLNTILNSIVPYVRQVYDCSELEAKTMINIVMAAQAQQLITEGGTKTPFGRLYLVAGDRAVNPLRVKLRPDQKVLAKINGRDLDKPSVIDSLLTPRHLEMLTNIRKDIAND